MKRFSTWPEITAVVLLILVLSTSGCSGGSDGGIVVIDQSTNESTLTLRVGQELELSLESNPTTGYIWQLTDLEGGVLVQLGEVEYSSGSELVGGGGVETFRFAAEKPGSATLRLEYLRPWEEGIAPEKVFSVEVVVEHRG
jgi:inhibitor of cysteine peptidase